ncbi:MAG: aminotransferase class V-fold PLP-dependent enzyme [Woeseiaceae bacterium]
MSIDRRQILKTATATLFAAGLYSERSQSALAQSTFRPVADDPDDLVFAEARKRFLFPTDITYGNTGTLGACPRDVMDAYLHGLNELEQELPDWPYFEADGEPLTGYQQMGSARDRIGAFVNADGQDIALMQNATMGMSCIANGIDLEPGDEVITTDQEHSGGVGSWRLRAARSGIVVKELPLDSALDGGPRAVIDLFQRAITPKTRVLMVSQITSAFGIVLPAAELCSLAAEHGILSVIDGAQALGQIPVDLQQLGCDAYVASPHKWLLAPKGTGFLYLRRGVPQRIWGTLAGSHYDDWESGAFRFMQFGTGSVPIVTGLLAAFDFIDSIGLQRIVRWDHMLNARLRDGLESIPQVRMTSPADRRFAAAITTFRVEGLSARDLQKALWQKKIRVRAQNDRNGVRFCTHLYVSPDDIDRALDVISSVV